MPVLPVFAGNLHAKRIESVANGALVAMTSGSLVVSIIGPWLAQAYGLLDKNASNRSIGC